MLNLKLLACSIILKCQINYGKLPSDLTELLSQLKYCDDCERLSSLDYLCCQIIDPYTIINGIDHYGHTHEGDCELCDGAPYSYHCESYGSFQDECANCGKSGVFDVHLVSCQNCEVLFCEECVYLHDKLVINDIDLN